MGVFVTNDRAAICLDSINWFVVSTKTLVGTQTGPGVQSMRACHGHYNRGRNTSQTVLAIVSMLWPRWHSCDHHNIPAFSTKFIFCDLLTP